MIMPFLRLVIIYIVVILGAVLVFKRDSVMSLLGMPWGGSNTEIAAEAEAPAKLAEPVVEPVGEPVAEPAATTGATETLATPVAEQPSKYPTEETAQTAAATPTPTPAPTSAPASKPAPATTPAPASVKDIQARLDAARSAYWSRDLKAAEARYKSLIKDAPTNADIKGELGNLYYGQRRMNEAADLYHQTGLQLIADGNRRQIMPLIGVLQSIAPDKARDLRNRLSQ